MLIAATAWIPAGRFVQTAKLLPMLCLVHTNTLSTLLTRLMEINAKHIIKCLAWLGLKSAVLFKLPQKRERCEHCNTLMPSSNWQHMFHTKVYIQGCFYRTTCTVSNRFHSLQCAWHIYRSQLLFYQQHICNLSTSFSPYFSRPYTSIFTPPTLHGANEDNQGDRLADYCRLNVLNHVHCK